MNKQQRNQKKQQRREARKGKAASGTKGISGEKLVQYLLSLQKQITDLDQLVRRELTRCYDNDTALKNGLNSAEFNLRAHQKVLNALAADTTNPTGALDRMEDKRINWEKYHQYVEDEIKQMVELEKQQELERRAEQVKKIEEDLAWFKERVFARVTGDDDKQKEYRANAETFFTATEQELKNFHEGKEYDAQKLDNITRLIEAEKKKVAEAKEGEEKMVVEPSAEENVKVFGG